MACPPMLTFSNGSSTWNTGGCWWLDRSRMAKSNSGVVCSPSDTSTEKKNTSSSYNLKKLRD